MINVEFILQSVVVAFWCWGFHNAFNEGEILGGPGKIMRKTLPEWIQKPTFGCPVCQASIHGTTWYLIFNNMAFDFLPWILFVVSVSGFNYVIKEHLYPDA